MIQQIIFLFSLLFSLSLLSSCTLFGSGDSSDDEQASEESYYEEEGEETKEEELTASGDEEDPYESDQSDQSDQQAENLSEQDPSSPVEGEDFYYIDEEDEDMVAEEGGVVEEEEYEASAQESTAIADSETTETSAEAKGGGSFFASSSVSGEGSSGDSGGGGGGGGSLSPPSRLSYKKIKNQAYKAGAFLVNGVYIARPGESLKSISNKIFGSEDTSQLQAVNPHLKLRQVKVGDKIYYQSPRRPSDSSQILFYFEEQGAQAHYRQIQAGQNIREVAKELLGHDSSWKEIWATNPNLQSKWTVGQAIEVKYWPASQEAEAPLSAESQEPADPAVSEGDPMADGLAADNDPAVDSDPVAEEEQLVEDSQDPPAPPSQEQAQVLEEMQKDVPGQKVSGFSKMFQSTDVVMGLALAFVAFVAFFVVMRKRKRKQNFDYTATNFEIEE